MSQTVVAESPKTSKWRSLAVNLLISLFSVFLALTAVEIYVRAKLPHKTSRPMVDFTDGVLTPLRNVKTRFFIPNSRKPIDHHLSTNSQGFRGQKVYSAEPPAETLRLASIGDSYTFGLTAEDHQSYPAVLETLLPKAEVINAGIPGSSLGDQILWYENQVRNFHPKLVILMINAHDPEEDANRGLFYLENGELKIRSVKEQRKAEGGFMIIKTAFKKIPAYSFLSENWMTLGLIRDKVSVAIASRRKARLVSPPASIAEVKPTENVVIPEVIPQPTQEELLFKALLGRLHGDLQKDGAKLMIIYPAHRAIVHPEAGFEDVPAKSAKTKGWLKEFSQSRNVPFLDLTPAMRSADEDIQPRSIYNFTGTQHPNADGYKIIAQAVAQFLNENPIST